ncbi:hypothetical protein ACSQ67_019983 [Phaseolus vulgaris]
MWTRGTLLEASFFLSSLHFLSVCYNHFTLCTVSPSTLLPLQLGFSHLQDQRQHEHIQEENLTQRIGVIFLEALRSSKREMAVATRGIEREITSLQMEEKNWLQKLREKQKQEMKYVSHLNASPPKLLMSHKTMLAATKILARQLVRLRQQITNLQGSRAQIRGVATHTQALYASTSISTGMKGATKAMVAMNKQMAPAKQVKVIREFQKQSAQLDMTIEMMSESIDETLDKDEAEEETEELTNQVLDEIGVDIASQLSSAPKGRIASRNTENVAPRSEESKDVEELEKRLASLRRI